MSVALGSAANVAAKRERWAWLIPVLIGALLGAMPHLVQRLARGTWTFLGDNDDAYYSMIARAPFYGSWAVRDPFASTVEAIRVSYAWGLFVPVAKLASLLGDSPAAFMFTWRVLGGAMLGAGLHCFVATIARRAGARLMWLNGPWGPGLVVATLCTFMLCDPGLIFGSLPVERLVPTLLNLLTHHAPRKNPGWYAQFRVVSPLCGVGIFLMLLGLVSRPRLTRAGVLGAGVLLGILMNLYFFFWTTMVGLLGIVLLLALFQPRRLRSWLGVRHSWQAIATILAIGLCLGLPQFVSDFSSFGDSTIHEALERTPRGLALAPANPARYVFLLGPRLWLACALVAVIAWRRRALRVAALVALLAFALGNSAVVTGLEFENYKWLHSLKIVSYLTVFLGLLMAARRLRSSFPSLPRALRVVGVCGAVAGCGLYTLWTRFEVLGTREAVEHTSWLLQQQDILPQMKALDPASLVVAPREAQALLLATRAGVLHESPHSVCSFVSDREFIERDTLSAWVLGGELSSLQQHSELPLRFYGETRSRWQQRPQLYAAAVAQRSREALERYGVRYVVNRCAEPPNPETGSWQERIHGASWCVWERSSGMR